jgi:hypothetical protein
MSSDRTGLMIIRAWIEPGSSDPLRAEIRGTTDLSLGFDGARTLTRSEAVFAAVQDWLADFMNGTAPPE